MMTSHTHTQITTADGCIGLFISPPIRSPYSSLSKCINRSHFDFSHAAVEYKIDRLYRERQVI